MSSSYDAALAIMAGPAAARSSPAASAASKPETSSGAESKEKEAEPLISPLGALVIAVLSLGGYALYKSRRDDPPIETSGVEVYELELLPDNPGRPPKRWWDEHVEAVAASGSAVDPAAVVGALWYQKMTPAERAAVTELYE